MTKEDESYRHAPTNEELTRYRELMAAEWVSPTDRAFMQNLEHCYVQKVDPSTGFRLLDSRKTESQPVQSPAQPVNLPSKNLE